jgi:hypothetical protein
MRDHESCWWWKARGLLSGVLFFVLVSGGVGCDASLPEPESPAAQLYQRRCSGCHRLYAPQVLTAEMWQFMIARMEQQLQRQGRPPLSEEERQTILHYLQKHSNNAS